MDLLWVVGQDADRTEAQVNEDLGANAVVAKIGRETELEVGVDGVVALLLKLVGLQLVEQPDPPALLREVEQNPLPLLFDHSERCGQLVAAVASHRLKQIAGETFGVQSCEHGLG